MKTYSNPQTSILELDTCGNLMQEVGVSPWSGVYLPSTTEFQDIEG